MHNSYAISTLHFLLRAPLRMTHLSSDVVTRNLSLRWNASLYK